MESDGVPIPDPLFDLTGSAAIWKLRRTSNIGTNSLLMVEVPHRGGAGNGHPHCPIGAT
jgi:hypothetical protein